MDNMMMFISEFNVQNLIWWTGHFAIYVRRLFGWRYISWLHLADESQKGRNSCPQLRSCSIGSCHVGVLKRFSCSISLAVNSLYNNSRDKIDINETSQYGRVHFISTRNLKRLFGEGILLLCLFCKKFLSLINLDGRYEAFYIQNNSKI